MADKATIKKEKVKIPKALPEDPVDIFLLFMDNPTKIRIMRDVLSGTKGFDELCRSTKCMKWQLKACLKTLSDYGLIKTTVYPGIPYVVEYTITKLGEIMKPTINAMAEWGYDYKSLITTKPNDLNKE